MYRTTKIILQSVLFFIISNFFVISMILMLKQQFFRFQKMADYSGLIGFFYIHGIIFLGMLIIVWLFTKYVSRESLHRIGLAINRKGIAAYFTGFAVACTMGLLTCLINYFIYQPSIKYIAKSIPFFLIVILLFFVLSILQAGYEELTWRSWGSYQLLKVTSPSIVIFITALLFSLVHLFNSGYGYAGLLSVFMQGILYGYAYHRSNSTWMAIGLHGGWNFILSGFILSRWFFIVNYNGTYMNEFTGAEGTVAGIIMPIIGCFAIYFITGRKQKSTEDTIRR